jgi:SAM-dependent methyltransferase
MGLTTRNGVTETRAGSIRVWGRRLYRAATGWWRTFNAREYWESRHNASAGQLRATGHLQLNEQENEADYRAKREQVVNTLKRHSADATGRTLLDAGCGTGIFTSSFVDMGFAVTGVDFSATAINSARLRTKAEFLVADLATMRLNQQYDVIASVDVLFHVVDDRVWHKTLGTLGVHLRQGGLMLIQEHLIDTTPSAADQQRHVRFRTLEHYRGALDGLRMRITYQHRYELPSERSWKNILIVEHAPG